MSIVSEKPTVAIGDRIFAVDTVLDVLRSEGHWPRSGIDPSKCVPDITAARVFTWSQQNGVVVGPWHKRGSHLTVRRDLGGQVRATVNESGSSGAPPFWKYRVAHRPQSSHGSDDYVMVFAEGRADTKELALVLADAALTASGHLLVVEATVPEQPSTPA